MIAVVDAGPVIHLSWLGLLALLRQQFEAVLITPAVQAELLRVTEDTLGFTAIQDALAGGWLNVRSPQRAPQIGMHQGEAEAISLALELDCIFVSDDLQARSRATSLGLAVTGTIGVLGEARDRGRLDAVLPLLLELRSLGQWIADSLIEDVRRKEQA